MNKPKTRYTIGLFVETLLEKYQENIWRGVVDAAEDFDINLVCLEGGDPYAEPDGPIRKTLIYNLIQKNDIDILIAISGAFCNFTNKDKLEEFFRSFEPIPFVSLAIPFKDVPSILVDNGTGMRDILVHLIEEHQCRNIAFIGGPDENPEAGLRFDIYQEVLREYGIPFYENLYVAGNYDRTSGTLAIDTLFDERNLHCDAIVAVDDYVALDAITALKDRGIRVPQDVIVTGFDDIEDSQYSNPSLSTVHQPLYELGYKGVQVALSRIRNEKVPKISLLPTRLILRQSCGCFIKGTEEPKSMMMLRSYSHQEAEIISEQDFIIRTVSTVVETLPEYFDIALYTRWITRLVQGILEDIEKKDQFVTPDIMEDILNSANEKKMDLSIWHTMIVSIITETTKVYTQEHHKLAERILWKRMKERIRQAEVVSQVRRRLESEDIAKILQRINQSFLTSYSIQKLRLLMAKELPELGIRTCFVYVYTDDTLENSRLAIAFIERPEHTYTFEEQEPSRNILVPQFVKISGERFAFMAIPLVTEDKNIGYVLFEISFSNSIIVETLSGGLSIALQGANLVDEVQKNADNLQRVNEELAKKNEYKSRYLATISHEMRTPLNSIIGFTQQLLYKNFDSTFPVIGMVDELAGLLEEYNECSGPLEELKEFSQHFLKALTSGSYSLQYFYYLHAKELYEKARNGGAVLPDGGLEIEKILNEQKAVLDEENQSVNKVLKYAITSSEYLLQLVDTILDISKIESGKISISKKQIHLVDFMDDILKNAMSYRRSKNKSDKISIEHSVGGGVPETWFFDPQRIKQVLLNLMSNAIKFTPQGKVYFLLESGEGEIIFKIRDTGVGIKEEDFQQLFKEFGRASSGDGVEGSGLGLAISKKLVELHGGTITFTSKFREGTEFVVTLPDKPVETAMVDGYGI